MAIYLILVKYNYSVYTRFHYFDVTAIEFILVFLFCLYSIDLCFFEAGGGGVGGHTHLFW
jgi:hypothetical protein